VLQDTGTSAQLLLQLGLSVDALYITVTECEENERCPARNLLQVAEISEMFNDVCKFLTSCCYCVQIYIYIYIYRYFKYHVEVMVEFHLCVYVKSHSVL
jgi:hypothetical protein